MTRALKKSCACVGCDFIDLKIGWPCNRCPRQCSDHADQHSQVNSNNAVIEAMGIGFSFNGSTKVKVIDE